MPTNTSDLHGRRVSVPVYTSAIETDSPSNAVTRFKVWIGTPALVSARCTSGNSLVMKVQADALPAVVT